MLADYLLFLAKMVTWVIALLILVTGIVAVIAKARDKHAPSDDGEVTVTHLGESIDEIESLMEEETLTEAEFKALTKQRKKDKKKEAREKKKKIVDLEKTEPRLFVIDFDGDMEASDVEGLREVITAIILTAKPQDEVLVRLESAGGYVHQYGLAASQLARLREHEIPLTVSVDAIAASGGYLMASVANRILAAPFALVGSIGVIAELPNFNRLLKKHDIEYEMHTSGQFKRTLTHFGENTREGREKFKEEIQLTHELFKNYLKEYRPELDLEAVSTGETWHGLTAVEYALVDEIMTSDEYILAAHQEDRHVYQVEYEEKESFMDKMHGAFSVRVSKWLSQASSRFFA